VETVPHRFVYKTAAFASVQRLCDETLIPAIAKLYNTPKEAVVLNWAYVRRYDPENRPGLHVSSHDVGVCVFAQTPHRCRVTLTSGVAPTVRQEHTDITDITVNIPLSDLPEVSPRTRLANRLVRIDKTTLRWDPSVLTSGAIGLGFPLALAG
jgi:hypothetical protein